MEKNNYYEQEKLWNRELTEQEKERIEIVKKYIPKDVKTILDAGCGNGAISNYLEGFDITAIDQSKEALKYVKSKTIQGSIDNLPFEDKSFDLIICSDVLEHLPEEVYYKTVKEFKRVSKKYILIISPNEEDLEANQCKCYKCGTVFHMNWHIRSISINDIINNFRDEFAPIYYSYFGEKWTSEPRIKYSLARMTDRGYKYWKNAICPMCGAKQQEKKEDTKDIDIKCNKLLNGFYNKSTEFIVLLSTVENKKNIFDFDKLNNQNIVLSKNKLEKLEYVNRQYIKMSEDIFIKKYTEFYPQYAYILDNKENEEKFSHKLICFPCTINSKKLYIEYQDNIEASVGINIYDLEKSYINIGNIEFVNDKADKTCSFEIPQDLVPPNEGLIFEVVFDVKNITFSQLNIRKIYIDNNFGNVLDGELESVKFLNWGYYKYQYNTFLQKNGEFLLLPKDALIYDKNFKCFYWNLKDTFEFFNNNKKLAKQTEVHENEINQIKNELADIKKELYHTKQGVYTVSNTLENLIYKLKNPFKTFFKFSKTKKQVKSLHSKHLVVITPDVKVDRRTVQMCQSLIKHFNIKCTIIAAFKEKDDFITDKLKVKRIDPNKSKKYVLKPDDWRDETNINLEEFYWLHYYYLHSALEEDADYIMCCDLPLLPAGVYVSKIKNIPLIYDAHELYPEQAIFEKEKRKFYSKVEAGFIKYPDLVITVNESIAEEMAKRYHITKPKVILNALDAPKSFDINKKYNYFREKLPIKENQKIVLFQGGYSPNRNLELLVKSAKFIKNSDVVIVMMGFGDYEKKLKQIAKDDKILNKKVFFFPAVSQAVLLEYSASADVGIIPYPHVDLNSYYCTPNKLFEFIQAGLPIIANDSPELNKFIKENDIGFTKKIENEKDIADMIDTYFKQNNNYKKNILKVRSKISWSVEEGKFIGMMKGII